MKRFFPADLKRIAVAAPASPTGGEKLGAGLDLLRKLGVEPVLMKNAARGSKLSWLSADPEFCAEDINSALNDSSFGGILCTRGGTGSAGILPLIDWTAFRARGPRFFLAGFSDITAVHFAMISKSAGRAVATQMAARLPEALADSFTKKYVRRVFQFDAEKIPFHAKLKVLTPGAAEGGIIPANLSLTASLCGTEYLPDLNGRILVLEDVGDEPRIVYRHLVQLLESGVMKDIAALVFGQFTNCGTPAVLSEIFRRTAGKVNVPVFSGLAYGHELPSFSFVWDERIRISAEGLFESL